MQWTQINSPFKFMLSKCFPILRAYATVLQNSYPGFILLQRYTAGSFFHNHNCTCIHLNLNSMDVYIYSVSQNWHHWYLWVNFTETCTNQDTTMSKGHWNPYHPSQRYHYAAKNHSHCLFWPSIFRSKLKWCHWWFQGPQYTWNPSMSPIIPNYPALTKKNLSTATEIIDTLELEEEYLI